MAFFSSSRNSSLDKPLGSPSDSPSSPKGFEPEPNSNSFFPKKSSSTENQSVVNPNPLSGYFRGGKLLKPNKELDRKIMQSSQRIDSSDNSMYQSLEGLAGSSNPRKKELLKEVQDFGRNKKATTEDLLDFFVKKTDSSQNAKGFREAEKFVESEFGIKKPMLEKRRREISREAKKMEQNQKIEQRKVDSQRQAFDNIRGIGKRVGGEAMGRTGKFNRMGGALKRTNPAGYTRVGIVKPPSR